LKEDITELVAELTDICRMQSNIIDRLYLKLAEMGAVSCMGDHFDATVSDVAKRIQKLTREP